MSIMDILVGVMCVVVVAALIMSFADGNEKSEESHTEKIGTEKKEDDEI